MRHITDGELHAWLDGALDLLPDGRGDEIREHLSRCSACRERMQDEEEVRDRSLEIMAGLQLRDLELPTFEELRERAAAPEPGATAVGALASGSREARPERVLQEEPPARYRGPLKGMPLAWAATIVLALGVGWMGGQVWHGLPQAAAPGGPREAGPSADFEGGRAGDGAGRLPGPGSVTVLEARSGGVGAGVTLPGEARTGVGAPATPLQYPGAEAGTDRRAPEPLVGEARALAPVGGSVVDPGSLAPRSRASAQGVEELAPSRVPEAVLSLQEIVLAGVAPAAGAAPWPPSLSGEADRFPESSLAVPGLKVLSVEWEEWLPGERVLQIRQLLAVGDTLELRYLGMLMGMEPYEEARVARKAQARDAGVDRPLSPTVLEASLPPGWNQVEMRWGRGWLVARAPLPEASIKALLRTLR